jgi:hypothetical protein
MRSLLVYLRAYSQRKHVRPWALSPPIIVLMICLPLLRPLRYPLPSEMSDDETSRWGTVMALVERQTFAIDQTPFAETKQKIQVGDAFYSDQPPVMGLLLSGPYWVIRRCGFTFSNNPALVEYLLTLVAVTLPTAAAAGMLYRMSRIFELSRPWRAGLATAVVLGSGLISYATVLNPYAPAAALVLLSAAILVQVSLVNTPLRSGGYLVFAGLFACLAAAIDPAAIVFTILFIGVIMAMRWRLSLRIGGVLMYAIGMLPPALLHVSLSMPITGDWRLGLTQIPVPAALVVPIVHPAPQSADADKSLDSDDDVTTAPPTVWQKLGVFLGHLSGAFLGSHGLLTHFPVLLVGFAGVGIVMHRHWPPTTKTLAIMSTAGMIIIILRYVWLIPDWRMAMFAVRWYVVFLPLTLFWAGAWVRRRHHPAVWATTAALLLFSILVSILGATDPMPKDGYERYTPVAALSRLTNADTPPATVLAGG